MGRDVEITSHFYFSSEECVTFNIQSDNNYSLLKLFIGLATATFKAWNPTVNKAIKKAIMPAIPNIHHDKPMRYANPSNQLRITNAVIGVAIIKEIATSARKSFDSVKIKLLTEAPKTFLTPISLVRCSTL